ncbi:MAG TPA: 4Fe-4S ferredoxin N-terminal domain-containing protein, partial [Acidimicrobiia bacterium]
MSRTPEENEMRKGFQDPADQESVWRDRARALLEGSGFDIHLGGQVARDAQRVIAGDLSAEDFGRRYHEAYLQEFGLDDRPDAPAAGDNDRAETTSADKPRLLSRREALGAIGGATAGVLFLGELYRSGVFARSAATGATSAGGNGAIEVTPVQYGMVIDLERCDGCLFCVDACRTENGLADGVLWPYVFSYKEPGDDRIQFLVRNC